MPFVYWQYNNLAPLLLPSKAPDALTPLQQLQQQKGGAAKQMEPYATTAAQSQQHSKLPADPADDGLLATAGQIAAAQNYLQNTVLHPKRRPAVPARQYVIAPEPYDMRQQHSKVCVGPLSSWSEIPAALHALD